MAVKSAAVAIRNGEGLEDLRDEAKELAQRLSGKATMDALSKAVEQRDKPAVVALLRRAGVDDDQTIDVGEMTLRAKQRGIHLRICRSNDPKTGAERCFTFDLEFTI